ncbi:MAG TPA: hypothetical protein VF359_09810 [Anaerolineales bacterium]
MLRKFRPIILLTLGMLLQVSPAPLRALHLDPDGFIPASIPAGTSPVIPSMQANLDGKSNPETVVLTGGRLAIYSGGGIVWQSPPEWQIVQAAISDLNQDKQPEVSLLLWRPFHSWPVDQWLPNGGRIADFHNAEGQSCNFIMIGWTRGGYHELWAGSAMADPITSFAAADLDGDNSQELVALEGRYADPRTGPETSEMPAIARTLKVWEWNGFGFTVVSSLDGIFNKMTLVQANNGNILILVP